MEDILHGNVPIESTKKMKSGGVIVEGLKMASPVAGCCILM